MLLRESTNFLLKFELRRRANIETVYLDTYIKVWRMNQPLTSAEPGSNIMPPTQSPDDNAHPWQASLICWQIQSRTSSGIRPYSNIDTIQYFVHCLNLILIWLHDLDNQKRRKIDTCLTAALNRQRKSTICIAWPTILQYSWSRWSPIL